MIRPLKVGMRILGDVNADRFAVLLLGMAIACVSSIASFAAAAAAPARTPGPLQTLIMWLPFILHGFALNLIMSFGAMALATVLGVLLGIAELSTWSLFRSLASFITQTLRNTPWIVILFAVMLLMPFRVKFSNGIDLLIPDWIKATIGFALPVMANIAEIVRGAIQSVPVGQWESADSLAFSRRQILWLVVIPQCIKRMIPPWMNWYAILALSTPIAAIMGVHEAVGNAQQAMEAAGARTSLLIPFYSFILLLFFVYIYPISRIARWLESKYNVLA